MESTYLFRLFKYFLYVLVKQIWTLFSLGVSVNYFNEMRWIKYSVWLLYEL